MKEELKAGRELDALIAEEVMGWTRQRGSFDGTTHWHPDSVILVGPNDTYSPHGLTTKPVTYIGNIVPHFSTSIADAWLVVEKLREDGWSINVAIDDEPWDSAGVYHVAMLGCNRGRTDCTDIRESADTAPLAICLAALEVVSSVPPIPKGAQK